MFWVSPLPTTRIPLAPVSDEPMASTIIRFGNSSRYWSLTVGEKMAAVDASTNSDDRSRASGPPISSERLDHRPSHGVTGDADGVDALALDGAPHLVRVELAEHDDEVALEREPEEPPLGGAVHQRRQVQATAAGSRPPWPCWRGPTRRRRARSCTPRCPHPRRRRRPPAATRRPSASRWCRRCRARSGRRRNARRSRARASPTPSRPRRAPSPSAASAVVDLGPAAVVDVDQVPEQRQRVAHGEDPGRELAVVDDRLEVGVVEEVLQLLLHVPVVHVHRHGPGLVGRQRRLDPLDAVGAVDADVVAGGDALRLEVVGELVGPGLQLRVGAALVADHEDLAISDRVDRVLEQVGDVVRHGI